MTKLHILICTNFHCTIHHIYTYTYTYTYTYICKTSTLLTDFRKAKSLNGLHPATSCVCEIYQGYICVCVCVCVRNVYNTSKYVRVYIR